MIERLQHRFRLLRGRRIVEIGEALAAHRFLEDRELSADRVQIEWQWLFSMAVTLLACAPIHAASPIALRSRSAPSWAVICRAIRVRRPACGIFSSPLVMKLSALSAPARASGPPPARRHNTAASPGGP